MKEYQPGTCFFSTNVCVHRRVLICVECKDKERNKLTEIRGKQSNRPPWSPRKIPNLNATLAGLLQKLDRSNPSPQR